MDKNNVKQFLQYFLEDQKLNVKTASNGQNFVTEPGECELRRPQGPSFGNTVSDIYK